MTILLGVSAFAAMARGFGCSRFCVTKMRPSRCFHRPAIDRAERRRARRLAGAQIEAGVMPRTAHARRRSRGLRPADRGSGCNERRRRICRRRCAPAAPPRRRRGPAAYRRQNRRRPTPLVRSGPLGGACSCAMAVFLRWRGQLENVAASKIDGSRPKRFRRRGEKYQFTVIAERKVTSHAPLISSIAP